MPPRQEAVDDVIEPRADMSLIHSDRRRGAEVARRDREGSVPPDTAEVRHDYKG